MASEIVEIQGMGLRIMEKPKEFAIINEFEKFFTVKKNNERKIYEKRNLNMRRIMRNKKDLKEVFERAKKNGLDVFLELEIPKGKTTEVVIVRYRNLDLKWNYYDKYFDENLKHKKRKDLQILIAMDKHFELEEENILEEEEFDEWDIC